MSAHVLTLPAAAPASPRKSRRWPPPGVLVGGIIALLLALAAVFGPRIYPVDPAHQDLLGRLQPPSLASGHPLGTDALGRDILARLLVGARISLLIGLAGALVAGAVGVVLGVLAGWLPGRVDVAIAWAIDVQMALPFVVVAIVATATFGPGLRNVLLTLTVTGWVGYARVMRLQTRSLRRAQWVEAATALGASPIWQITHHVAPHLAGVAAILVTQQVSAMILYEASLSFLGLGVGGDAITWGGMAAEGRDLLLTAPWVCLIPGGAVAVVVLGLTLLGDAVATAGPRMRR